MKKLFSLLLALVMVLSLSVSAFAYQQWDTAEHAADPYADPSYKLWTDDGGGETLESLGDSADFDVYYNFAGGVNSITEPVYSVTITWSFTLDEMDTLDTVYRWDTAALKYVAVEGATATLTGGEIPVNICLLNNSNVPVDANCTWDKDETYFYVDEHDKVVSTATDFETLSLPSACKEGSSPEDLKYAYGLIDTEKTAERDDGKLVFMAGVDPTEETYNYKTTGVAGFRFDEQWNRTIKVSLKNGVDYSDPYGAYAKNKIGTYTVTLSAHSAVADD